MSASPLRVAVVGAGSIGREFALEHFGRTTQTRVVAICDLDLKAAAALASDVSALYSGGCLGGSKYRETVSGGGAVSEANRVVAANGLTEEVLAQVDAVYIGTPPSTHASITVTALRAEKHVLLEKPLASNMADAEKIVSAAREARKAGLHCGMNIGMRWNKAAQEMKRRVAAGELGALHGGRIRLLFVQWPREWQVQPWCGGRAEGGALREVGSHFVAGLYEVFGFGSVSKVRAQVSYPDGEAGAKGESSAVGLLLLDNGLEVEIDVRSGVSGLREDVYELELRGERGSLTLYDFTCLKSAERNLVSDAAYGRQECIKAMVQAAGGAEEVNTVTAEQGREVQLVLEAIVASGAAGGAWVVIAGGQFSLEPCH